MPGSGRVAALEDAVEHLRSPAVSASAASSRREFSASAAEPAGPQAGQHDALEAQLPVLDLGDVLELGGQPGDAAQRLAVGQVELLAVALVVPGLALGECRAGPRQHAVDHAAARRSFASGRQTGPLAACCIRRDISPVEPPISNDLGVHARFPGTRGTVAGGAMTEHYFSRTMPAAARDAAAGSRCRSPAARPTSSRRPASSATDRLDLGTRVLLRRGAAAPPAGDLLDLGCGWGPLALTLARWRPARRGLGGRRQRARAGADHGERARGWGWRGVRAVAPDEVPDDVRVRRDLVEPADPDRQGGAARAARWWLPRLAPGGAGVPGRAAQPRRGHPARAGWPSSCRAGTGRSRGPAAPRATGLLVVERVAPPEVAGSR